MKNIRRVDLRVGEPLPWPVYDRNGRLLLRRGVRLAFEHQIDRLAEQGLFIPGDDADTVIEDAETPADTFDWLLATAWSIKPLLQGFLSRAPAPDGVTRVRQRAMKVLRACEADPESALASIHLDFHNPYPLAHPVHVAILCALIGQRLGVEEREQISLLCAALTCDLGMFDFPHLEKQSTVLGDDQASVMHRHPSRSAALLELADVCDANWLDIVLCHHERWNGSGYPERLAREAIPQGARIFAVADSYAAMIKPRPYRGARSPSESQSDICRDLGALYDPDVCGALINEVGVYPPGSFVRIESRETAVVRTRRRNDEWLVHAIYGDDDLPYLSPRRRNVLETGFGIVAARRQSECRASESIVRRLWR